MRRTIALALTLAALGGAAVAPVARAQSSAPEEPVVLTVGTHVDLTTTTVGGDGRQRLDRRDHAVRHAPEVRRADLRPRRAWQRVASPTRTYMRWTCTLREGLRWSDGDPLTSEDVAFTYRFVIDHRFPAVPELLPLGPRRSRRRTSGRWSGSRRQPTFAPDMPPWVYIVPEHVWEPYVGAESERRSGCVGTAAQSGAARSR